MQRQGRRRHQRGVGGDVGEIARFWSGPQFVRPQGPHKNGGHGLRVESQRSSRQVRMLASRRRDFRGTYLCIISGSHCRMNQMNCATVEYKSAASAKSNT